MQLGVLANAGQIAETRVLLAALRRFHPGWPQTVLFTGASAPSAEDLEGASLVSRADLASPATERFISMARLAAAATLLRPLLVRHLLDRNDGDVIVLAADSEVLGPLAELEEALTEHAAVILERVHGRLPNDGERPDGRDLIERGEIDDGLVAVRNDDMGRELIEWWIERSLEQLEADPASERPLNVLAGARRVFAGVLTFDHPGYGLSLWNLHERALDGTVDDPRVGGAPARLFRFEGFRPDRPWWLGDLAGRVVVLDNPRLTELCGRRSTALLEAGWALDPDASEDSALGDELRGEARTRRLHAEALAAGEDFGDLETPAGLERFLGWLREPAPQGATLGVNRYAYDVWRERPDLQEAYPDLDGPDGGGFVGWLWVHGRTELSLTEHLLPPPPSWLPRAGHRLPAVEVVGYLRGNLGLGQAARGYVTALRAAGVEVATRTISPDPRTARPAPQRVERFYEDLDLSPGLEPEANLLCVNADQVPELAADLGADKLHSRYTIGQWAWETDAIPPRWDPAFELVDEIWVYSTYVAENIARSSPVPVVVVPLPVLRPDVDPASVALPLATDTFVFLFAFDYLSTLQRKNPEAVIEAFSQAFEPGEGPTLLLKTINAELRPEARERLRWRAGGRTDIVMLDETLGESEMHSLLARADCYVSLHRSEGFGLPLAESMSLGKPVIATHFGGNTDFMTPANSFLVDWTPTDVGPDAEHYPPEGSWAEPSVQHAATLLRKVWERPEEARRRGVRAADDIAERLSAEAVGTLASARLQRVWARRGKSALPAEAQPWPLEEVVARLEFDLRGAQGSGLRELLRRGALRAMRPYTAPQRSLDEAAAAALRRLFGDLAAERSARERDRARIARLEASSEALEAQAVWEGPPDRMTAGREDTRRQQEPDSARLGAIADSLEPLVAGARAVPLTFGDPFHAFDHPVAGRVLGFRDRRQVGTAGQEYRRFEDVFRGSRERVTDLVAPYMPLLRDHGPVLDVGCGRGELIEALAESGVEARGVDVDAGMADVAKGNGLDILVAEGVSHLQELDAASLGAVTAMHVIEHLPLDQLQALLRFAALALRPGGLLVVETVNPHAAFALKTFWVDPTHRHPLFPEAMLVMAETAGFQSAYLWHPRGVGDVEVDRFREDSYSLVAER